MADKKVTIKEPVVDPEPLDIDRAAPVSPEVGGDAPTTSPAPSGPRRVRILGNEISVPVAGAHYTLRAGDIMVVSAAVADGLISMRLAEET